MLDPLAAARLVRQEWSRVVAVAMRILGDLDEAEDMAQEALLEATRRWPVDGVPANPGAWLTTVARNRALNRRRDQRRRGGPPLLLEDGLDAATTSDVTEHAELDGLGDDRLRLVVLYCHPSLPHDAQVALTLRLVGGLTAREIANAFVQREATVASGSPGPRAASERSEPASSSRRWPSSRRAWGPCWRSSISSSTRATAPTAQTTGGAPVPLDEQDRSRWDRRQIRLGEACLAAGHNAAGPGRPVGSYLLQAEIAARHARAATFADTDWDAIQRLYAALAETQRNVQLCFSIAWKVNGLLSR